MITCMLWAEINGCFTDFKQTTVGNLKKSNIITTRGINTTNYPKNNMLTSNNCKKVPP